MLFGSKKHPKGPNFNRARELAFDYSGNKFSFKAPFHSMSSYSADICSNKANLYNNSEYIASNTQINKIYVLKTGYREDWQFTGVPIVQGYLGRMSMSLTVLRTESSDSLFNKIALESELLRQIEDTYGPLSVGDPWNIVDRFNAPLNWGSKVINGTEWVRYEMEEKSGYLSYCIYAVPLTDKHFAYITFVTRENESDYICKQAFNGLMQNILGTLKLELSPESLKQQAEAEKQNPGQKYSDFKPVFEWPEFETMKPEEDEYAKAIRELRQKRDGFEA